jgi:hypothetical protein
MESLNYVFMQRKLFSATAVTRRNLDWRYASLLERRAVGYQETPNFIIPISGKKRFCNAFLACVLLRKRFHTAFLLFPSQK